MDLEINISVPYTESQLSADEVEEYFNENNFNIEVFLTHMYNQGYNIDIFEE